MPYTGRVRRSSRAPRWQGGRCERQGGHRDKRRFAVLSDRGGGGAGGAPPRPGDGSRRQPLAAEEVVAPNGSATLRTSSIPGRGQREGERLSGPGWAAGSGVVAFTGDVPGLRLAQCLLANSPAAVVPGMCPGEGLLHASIATGLLGSAQRRAVPVRCRASLGSRFRPLPQTRSLAGTTRRPRKT